MVVCGGATGVDGDVVTNECNAYDPAARQWHPFGTMAFSRKEHAASVMPDGRWIITGGVDSNGEELDTTEFLQPGSGVFLPGLLLPYSERGHCQLTIDDHTVRLVHYFPNHFAKHILCTTLTWQIFIGAGNDSFSSLDYFFDIDTGEVTELPPMPEELEYPSCGLATK